MPMNVALGLTRFFLKSRPQNSVESTSTVPASYTISSTCKWRLSCLLFILKGDHEMKHQIVRSVMCTALFSFAPMAVAQEFPSTPQPETMQQAIQYQKKKDAADALQARREAGDNTTITRSSPTRSVRAKNARKSGQADRSQSDRSQADRSKSQ
jgi:hypothetical protein